MEEQIGGGTKDRAELRELTRKLQIISQNADSHIANADVAIISAKGIHAAHAKLHMALESAPCSTERGADTIEYVINSLEKQKLWFLNYKNRKDGMMSLVFNLVTQQDAANSIEIAADTKRDSTSMNAIAALTMIFLPGTFTAVSRCLPLMKCPLTITRPYLGQGYFLQVRMGLEFGCPIFGGFGSHSQYR